MAEEERKPEQDPKSGRFLAGNNGGLGRPKGSGRKQLASAFVEDMQKAWEARGAEVLQKVIDTDPAAFLRSMVAILPKELDVNVTRYDEMTDGQLRNEFLAALREARALGIDIGAGGTSAIH